MPGVPYTFANATTSIPLSHLDANFNTTATLGNASIGLGNVTTTVGNLTLQNVTITSGSINASVVQSGYAANAVIYSTASGNLTGNATIFSVNNGNVGIGTSSASYPLDIIGASVSPVLRLRSTFSGGSAQISLDAASGAGANQITYLRNGTNTWAAGGGNIGTGGLNDYTFYNYTLSANALTILNSNNYVGIGTVNPSYRLDLGSTGNAQFFGATNGIDANFGLTFSSNTITLNNGGGAGVMAFSTASSERMRIDSSGNVLINTTSATSYFSNYNKSGLLSGQTGASQVNGAYSFLNYSGTTNNATVDALRFLQPSGQQMSDGYLSGIVSIYVSGASGANSYTVNYALTSGGNGTASANLALIGTASTRGTNPVSSVQVAADGGGGAIKITITYINNSGVVTGGYAIASFTGIVSPT